jgi:hypothetical protein
METQASPLLIARWTSRAQPMPRALRPGYVGIDERGFAELLADTVHFGRFVRFFNAEDQEQGDWESLLAADGTAVLALLATLDVEGRSRAVQALVDRIRGEPNLERKEELARRLLSTVFHLAAQVDRWLAPAENLIGPGDRLVREMLEAIVIAELAPRLRLLVEIVAAAERAGLFEESIIVLIENFGPIWMIEIVEIVEIDPRFERDLERWLEALLDEIADLIQGFTAALASLSTLAAGEIEASLLRSDHRPHMALTMAFITLYRHAQGLINQLPRRIADFYQNAILHEAPEAARPDRLFLTFTPAARGRAPLPAVPAGSEFPAGKDASGSAVFFNADTALTVTGARPTTLRIWEPVGDPGLLGEVNALALNLSLSGKVGRPLLDAAGLPAASIGLVVAAPMLSLESGSRVVRLGFTDITPPRDMWAMTEMLEQAFTLSYSSTAGWIEVAADASFDLESMTIGFTLKLAAGAPPLTVCTVPGSNAPGLPAIRIMLNQGAADQDGTTALAAFGAMKFAKIRIEIWVGSLGGFTLATPSGPASPGPAIAPFGSPAIPGGSFSVSHPAFALPSTTDIALALRWSGLPTQPGGFDDYYRQYVIGPERYHVVGRILFDNGCFEVCLSGPGGKPERFSLFQAPPRDGRGDPEGGYEGEEPPTELPLSIAPSWTQSVAPPPPIAGTGDTLVLAGTSWFSFLGSAGSPATGSAVNLALTAPPYGFGDSLYPANVAYATGIVAAAEEPRRKDGLVRFLAAIFGWLVSAPRRGLRAIGRLFTGNERSALPAPEGRGAAYGKSSRSNPGPAMAKALPNPPWRPILASIAVFYRAESESRLGEAKVERIALYHLPPFDDPIPVPLSESSRLLPDLPAQPCFDLLVEGWPVGQALSLLFTMAPWAGSDAAVPGKSWQYRTDGEWIDLPADALVADGTAGLSHTGIVTIRSPADADAVWLRAVADASAGGFPPVAAIVADAITATRSVPASTTDLAPVPAGTITKAPGLAGIARVAQPLSSFGGTPAESAATLPARTSARLRHKGRGILEWDVERLVLENFPGIAKVRVLQGEAAVGPGEVLVVVIPARDGLDPPDPIRPGTPLALRGEIAAFLAARMSPFCRINVLDPAYAAVDVDAALLFSPGAEGAALLREDLADLLSPWAEPTLALAADCDAEILQARIAGFIRSRPYVAGVQHIAAELILPVPEQRQGGAWWVPVAGNLRIEMAAAADLAGAC